MLVEGGFKVRFDGLPGRFRNNEGTKDEDRLLRVGQVGSGVSRFVEIDQIHGEISPEVRGSIGFMAECQAPLMDDDEREGSSLKTPSRLALKMQST